MGQDVEGCDETIGRAIGDGTSCQDSLEDDRIESAHLKEVREWYGFTVAV